ncbi:MAG TPA: pantoate--beta-alanine ligase [Ignavibacteria bacterium]|nr:pantoate--beta-alanine ligase [Ignavibacteria bacterium]HMR40568.1 pantoate--beta-alanine ligase [Ignavibacteria bacterium]
MKVIKEISAIQEISDYYKCIGKKVALVPTMGFLHAGHTSLMLKAKDENDITVVSIFVNPSQFGRGEDFDKYPRDITRDYHICEKAGVDIIFCPEIDEMYNKNNCTSVIVSEISEKLEGKFRPGHFSGVATIVTKLLNAVKPVKLYLGQKDAQQNVIIKKLISDLNMETGLVVCKTMREDNGLAMSSRNTFLSETEKSKAAVLKYILDEGKRLITEENIPDPDLVIKKVTGIFKERTPEFEMQYYAITDNEVLDPIKNLAKYKGEVLISLAAKAGSTRLIDNIIFEK